MADKSKNNTNSPFLARNLRTLTARLLGQTPDEEMAIWPEKICFIEPWINGEQVQKLRFTNRCYKFAVVYRIMITSPEMYVIQPRYGFIGKGKSTVVTVKLNSLNKVIKLKDQGLQIEVLYWNGNKFDDQELEIAMAHIRDNRTPYPILQRVRIFYPSDVTFLIPENHKLTTQSSTTTD